MKIRQNKLIYLCAIVVCSAMIPAPAWAEAVTLPNGAKLDLTVKCPVCNMELASGKLGPAAAVFKDGKVVGFDSTGDMFRYLLDPKKYGFDREAVQHVYVTQYGTKQFIDAKEAVYVLGSDLKGSMGPEVVPFADKAGADEFMKAHHGKKIVTFAEVGLSDLKPKKGLLKMKHGH
ncbi:MAG: nitrous oxide reductase accessory protein NosL [Desulfomonilaceae bacterium]|nr:nitrous oxide reductase accessory protein NosL [Desulfomonilaceae bacterium]